MRELAEVIAAPGVPRATRGWRALPPVCRRCPEGAPVTAHRLPPLCLPLVVWCCRPPRWLRCRWTARRCSGECVAVEMRMEPVEAQGKGLLAVFWNDLTETRQVLGPTARLAPP